MYTKEMLDRDLSAYVSRHKEIDDRVNHLDLIHEDLVLIHRYDQKKLLTFLHTDPKAEKENIRTSWYGRVLKISSHPSGDDIRDMKKTIVKVGDIISYNPESSYSLNLHDFYEVWVIGIENVLTVDRLFDPIKMMENNLTRRLELEGR